MRRVLASAVLLAATAASPSAASGHTFSGTCVATGTATFTGPVTNATYVVVDASGWCTGLLDLTRPVHTPITLHAEATPLLGGMLAFGYADLAMQDPPLTFRLYLHHVTPPLGVDSDGRGGYAVTDETPLEPPRCDGRLPWESVPPESPADCTGTATAALAIAARTLTPIHSG